MRPQPRMLAPVPRCIALVCVMLVLAACGSTSGLQKAGKEQGVIDLTPYKTLLVLDFTDEASQKLKPAARAQAQPKIDSALKVFPDELASVVRAAGGFDQVLRAGTPDSTTLVLRGAITEFNEGSATLRLMVGMGAGTANFNARVELVDGASDKLLGSWDVDKNSWILGGAIAAAQHPEDFMQGAATSIGTELSKKKKEGQVKRPQN